MHAAAFTAAGAPPQALRRLRRQAPAPPAASLAPRPSPRPTAPRAGAPGHRRPTPTSTLIVRASATSPSSPPSSTGRVSAPALGVGLAAAAGLAAWQAGWLPVIKAALEASALGTSGALAAFSLVFLSELGDKTFFLAGLLAMRVGRGAALVGSVAALALMTGVSVAIGAAFQAVPTAISSSVNVSKWASTACLVYFGLKTLKAAWETPACEALPAGAGNGAAAAAAPTSATPDLAPELAAAQEELEAAEKSGRVHDTAGKALEASAFSTWARSASEVASIIFLAEWGDRSMLATIALAAAQNPAGVAAGAVGGHAVATAIAVWGGVLVARHLSERTVGLIGGALFLVFAGLTLGGWM